MLEENLKTVRTIHSTLIILCVTIFAIILSNQNDYTKAIAELKSLDQIDLKQFIGDSLEKVEPLGKNSDIAHIFPNAFDFAMRNEFEKIGFKVLRESTGHEVFLASFNEERVWNLLRNGTVSDYRDFISDNMGVDFIFVEPEKIAEALIEKVSDMNIPVNSEIGGMKLIMSRPVHTDARGNTFRIKLILLFFVEKPTRYYMVDVEKNFVSKGGQVNETRIQNWLRKRGALKDLVESSVDMNLPYNTESLFPNLKHVEDLIANKTPKEAIRILEEKAMKEVLLLGISFDIGIVVIVAPIATIIIYLLFISHLVHIMNIYKDGEVEILCKFPWLLLFPGKIYALISWALILLPSLSLFFLVYRFWYIGIWKLILGIVLAFLSFTLACYCMCKVNNLRKKVPLSAV